MALWRVGALGAVFQSGFLNYVKYFILSCIECLLLWSIVDIFLYPTLCDCSLSCFDPVYLLLAYYSGLGCTCLVLYHQPIFNIKNKQQDLITSSRQQDKYIKNTVLKTL